MLQEITEGSSIYLLYIRTFTPRKRQTDDSRYHLSYVGETSEVKDTPSRRHLEDKQP